jgi:NAD-dependent deacetylase
MSPSLQHRPNLVVLSGAGVSAESGLKTFRDSGGLWEGYDVRDVATPEAWHRNPELVLQFYNQRRKALKRAEPNQAHLELALLEKIFKVNIITQNVDDLHERAGSSSVLHLHGELLRARSSVNPELSCLINGDELKIGDRCQLGSQLRPDIVWFGEEVPKMPQAQDIVSKADLFLVIGCSLVVYPAANLVNFVPNSAKCFLIDPAPPAHLDQTRFTIIKRSATRGIHDFVRNLKATSPIMTANTVKAARITQ